MIFKARLAVFLLICTCYGIIVFAQTSQKQQKPEQDQSVQLQTQLIEIRAVVTDKQGHVIKNLKKEDFELLENKNPQEISFFSMEDIADQSRNPSNPRIITSSPEGKSIIPAGSPARTVVLYIDTLNLSTDSLLRTKQVLNKFIDEQLTDRDLTALITSTGALGVLEQFTRDKRILHYAVNRLGASLSNPDSMFTPYIAAMVLDGDPTAMGVAISILRTEDHLTGDRRFMVMMAQTKAQEVLAEASYRRKSTLWTLKAVAERLAELPGQRIIAIVSDGFSLMDNGGSPDTTDLNSVIGRAVRSGVVIYSIDAKGLTPPPEFNAAMPGVTNPTLSSYLSVQSRMRVTE
ncbi:MAG TPA: VWA domain-containing protein [Blastocatellia bacterium]|nr:VWA domain-containing protein [Blastocatellia bacterium]